MNVATYDNLRSYVLSDPRYHTLKRFNIIVTVRSLLLLLFVTYLIVGPIAQHSDIVATVVAASLLCFISLLILITSLSIVGLKRNFSLEVVPPRFEGEVFDAAAGEAVAGVPARFVIRTSPLSIFPGFVLRIHCEFSSPEMRMSIFQLTGHSSDPRLLIQDLAFPHRGIWKLSSVSLQFGDRLDFTSYHWDLPPELLEQAIRVSPPKARDTDLPVISSSTRAGDLLPDTTQRQGDPYDLKQYHPSDGIRKILWKIYAKSGELIARHPEASMTPEGQVLIFTLARKHEDMVCAATVAYLEYLEELALEVLLLCEGAADSPVAQNSESALDLLIESAWESDLSTPQSLEAEIESLLSQYRARYDAAALQRIVIFCSKQRLSTEDGYESAIRIGHYLERRNTKPVFCVVQPGFEEQGQEAYFDEEFPHQPPSRLERLLDALSRLMIKRPPEPIRSSERLYSKFMITCANNDWQTYV